MFIFYSLLYFIFLFGNLLNLVIFFFSNEKYLTAKGKLTSKVRLMFSLFGNVLFILSCWGCVRLFPSSLTPPDVPHPASLSCQASLSMSLPTHSPDLFTSLATIACSTLTVWNSCKRVQCNINLQIFSTFCQVWKYNSSFVPLWYHIVPDVAGHSLNYLSTCVWTQARQHSVARGSPQVTMMNTAMP